MTLSELALFVNKFTSPIAIKLREECSEAYITLWPRRALIFIRNYPKTMTHSSITLTIITSFKWNPKENYSNSLTYFWINQISFCYVRVIVVTARKLFERLHVSFDKCQRTMKKLLRWHHHKFQLTNEWMNVLHGLFRNLSRVILIYLDLYQ